MFLQLEDCETNCRSIEPEYYREGAQDLILKLIPSDILESTNDLVSRIRFNDLLPIIQISDLNQAPCHLSVLLLCKHRSNVSLFFYEMISRWLLPQKKLNVELFFTSDIRLPKISEELFCIAEIVIEIKSTQELEEIRKNIKQIETEIRLGVVSHYQAQRILEFKGLSNDGKTAMIQEKIRSLIQSRSKDFDRGIFSQMQHFLINCPEEFKSARDYHHISRMISNLYSLQKLIRKNIESVSSQRHIILKFLKTQIKDKQNPRNVLGVLVGLSFLKEHEIFNKDHLINAIRAYLPNVHAVDGSFFVERVQGSLIQTNYIEIEKDEGDDFTFEEIQVLRARLPDQLKLHIEQLTHPLFMPRNEEEVFKNIMTLSKQLRFVTDLPQVMVSFDEQLDKELRFTVIVVRAVTPNEKSIEVCLKDAQSKLKIIPDRIRCIGAIGKKYKKEATVFRACIDDRAILRADHSLNLYQARQSIIHEISQALGPVRDYNGGMIGKQNEVLVHLKRILGRYAQQHEILLEKFFFSLAPMELRSVMDAENLKQLFLLVLQMKKNEEGFCKKNHDFLFKQEETQIYIVLPNVDAEFKEKITRTIQLLNFPPYQLISFVIESQEIPCAGFMLQCDNLLVQKQFYDVIEREWLKN